MEFLLSVDQAVLDVIQKLHCPFLDALMPVITALGNGGMVWIVAGILCLLHPKYRRTGVTLLCGLLLGLLVCNFTIKPLVARARPFDGNELIELLIERPGDFSFPSGHTASSFIAAAVLWRRDRRFGIPAMALASLIAFSRLYLYVHYPSDVLAGAVIGLALGLAVNAVADDLYRRRQQGSAEDK